MHTEITKKLIEELDKENLKNKYIRQITDFRNSLDKSIELKRAGIELSYPAIAKKHVDIRVNPVSKEDANAIKKRNNEINPEKIRETWLYNDLGYLRVEMVDYGKLKKPALLISEIQPALYWEMPSSFRKKYKDWYKKLYEEIEKKAKQQGIERVLIATPSSIRKKQPAMKLPYSKISQLYREFPVGKGFRKKKVIIKGQTTAFNEGFKAPIDFRGQSTIQRKLWYKRIKR